MKIAPTESQTDVPAAEYRFSGATKTQRGIDNSGNRSIGDSGQPRLKPTTPSDRRLKAQVALGHAIDEIVVAATQLRCIPNPTDEAHAETLLGVVDSLRRFSRGLSANGTYQEHRS